MKRDIVHIMVMLGIAMGLVTIHAPMPALAQQPLPSTPPANPESCGDQDEYRFQPDGPNGPTYFDNCDDFDTSLHIAETEISQADWTRLNIVSHCPCTQLDAQNSNELEASNTLRNYFHPGSTAGYRSSDAGTTLIEGNGLGDIGQQCIYRNAQLIVGGSAAGTPDLVAPNQGTFGHNAKDVVPFAALGWDIYTRYWIPDPGNNCESDQTISVTPITLGVNQNLGGSLVEDSSLPITRLPNAIVGQEYADQGVTFTVSGALQFRVQEGGDDANPLNLMDIDLPPGLSLSSPTGNTFTITGTPEEDGAGGIYTFTIYVEETGGRNWTGSRTFEILVVNPVDIVFAVDVSGSMGNDIADVRRDISQIVDDLDQVADTRFGIVSYRFTPGSAGRVLTLTDDRQALETALNGLGAGGGGAEVVYTGALGGLSMMKESPRENARRILLVLGDEPPARNDSVTLQDVVNGARDFAEIGTSPLPPPNTPFRLPADNNVADTINDTFSAQTFFEAQSALLDFDLVPIDPSDSALIYPIAIGGWAGTIAGFQPMADGTGGQVLTTRNASELSDTILAAIFDTFNIPTADAGGPYEAAPNESITLDASGSSDSDGTIVEYAWDFNNDGTYEIVTDAPQASTSFGNSGERLITLRVTDNDGRFDVDNALVSISGQSSDDDSDSADDGDDDTSVITVTDDGGLDFDGDGIADVDQLPATGETPWWRTPFLVSLAGLATALLGLVALRSQAKRT